MKFQTTRWFFGAISHDDALAPAIESAMESDMAPGNSWNAAADNPYRCVAISKRKICFYQLLPIKPLL